MKNVSWPPVQGLTVVCWFRLADRHASADSSMNSSTSSSLLNTSRDSNTASLLEEGVLDSDQITLFELRSVDAGPDLDGAGLSARIDPLSGQ